jgi:hypothetical protein
MHGKLSNFFVSLHNPARHRATEFHDVIFVFLFIMHEAFLQQQLSLTDDE